MLNIGSAVRKEICLTAMNKNLFIKVNEKVFLLSTNKV